MNVTLRRGCTSKGARQEAPDAPLHAPTRGLPAALSLLPLAASDTAKNLIVRTVLATSGNILKPTHLRNQPPLQAPLCQPLCPSACGALAAGAPVLPSHEISALPCGCLMNAQ